MSAELAEEMAAWTTRTHADAQRLAKRELRPCQCGHKGRTHGSTSGAGVIVATGTGSCGHCPCQQLTDLEIQ